MPNIGALLKAEISRLSRREIRQEVASLKKASAASRRHIAALKRQVSALEKKASLLAKQSSRGGKAEASSEPGQPIRFVAKGLRSLRKRLGLSAPQLAKLLSVSEQSVYNWETKKATPRKEQVAAIAGMRSLGKRDVQQQLAELSKKSASKRAPVKRRRKRA
jgi:DNA-binding transcriptional regulator YiaG